MKSERVLTVVGVFVSLVLGGMLILTPINGRQLTIPFFRAPAEPETPAISVRYELARLTWRQRNYHVSHGAYAEDVEQLRFRPEDDKVTIEVQAADSTGWTAVAVSSASPVVCVRSGGTGPAASLDPTSLRVPESHAGYQEPQRCEPSGPAIAPQVISSNR